MPDTPTTAVMLEPSELRDRMPEELFRLPLLRTILKALLLIGVVAALFFAAVAAEPVWLKALLGVLTGVPVFTLAAIGHEAGHRTASRNPFINDLAGLLSMSLVGIPARGWKIKHDLHHRHTGVPEHDSDTQPSVARYLALPPARRRLVRLFHEHEFLFWPLTTVSLWVTAWRHSIRLLMEGPEASRRNKRWNIADMCVSAAFFLVLAAFGYTFGLLNLLLCVAVPFAIAGVIGAMAFVTNHRSLPPLTAQQQSSVVKYFYLNTRTVLFPRWLPGNYFMNYVPWQTEHHMFPTIAGHRLREVAPHLRSFAREKGARLNYEGFFECLPRVLASRHAWGEDGRLYAFRDLDRSLRSGTAPAVLNRRPPAAGDGGASG